MYRIVRVLRIIPIIIVASLVFGFITRELWNWLMPTIFGLHTITFWQAIGLFLLSKLIFGGFHGHHGGGRNWKGRMKERWDSMTPEEREKFRNGMRCGRGPFGRGRSPWDREPFAQPREPFAQPQEPRI
jgi:hypothetical protein